MAYDRDGTQVFTVGDDNSSNQLSSATTRVMNNEFSDMSYGIGYMGMGQWIVFIFPELRDLDGYFITGNELSWMSGLQTSVNSTNGVDGTWVTQVAGTPSHSGPVVPYYRTLISSLTVLGIKALRFHMVGGGGGNTNMLYSAHFYGEVSPGQNPNRLILWHPTLDQRVGAAYFDWGNVPRSSSADKTFRVKNNSATLTASAVRIAMDVLADTAPSVPGQHSISKDGMTFGSQQTLTANLAPGAISPVLTLRRVTPTDAVLSVWALRVFAEAGGWA